MPPQKLKYYIQVQHSETEILHSSPTFHRPTCHRRMPNQPVHMRGIQKNSQGFFHAPTRARHVRPCAHHPQHARPEKKLTGFSRTAQFSCYYHARTRATRGKTPSQQRPILEFTALSYTHTITVTCVFVISTHVTRNLCNPFYPQGPTPLIFWGFYFFSRFFPLHFHRIFQIYVFQSVFKTDRVPRIHFFVHNSLFVMVFSGCTL